MARARPTITYAGPASKNYEPRKMMRIVDEHVFPFLSQMGDRQTSTSRSRPPLRQLMRPPLPIETAPSSAASCAESTTSALETALEILKDRYGTGNPHDVVQAPWGDAQKILA